MCSVVGLSLAVVAAPVPDVALPALEAEAYFAGGPFAPARRLVARGAHQQAVKTLKRLLQAHPEAPERPQARYLLGLSLIRSGAYSEAAALFDDLSRTYPALRDDHTYYRGQALYLWGSYLDAAKVLDQIADGPWAAPARRLRAWSLLKATDFGRLVDWLEAEQTADDVTAHRGGAKTGAALDDELTFVLAEGRVRTRDIVGAFRSYRRVWRTTNRADLAGPALAAMGTLKVDDRPLLPGPVAAVVRGQSSRLQNPNAFVGALERLARRLRGLRAGQGLRAEIAYARGRIAEAAGGLSSAARWYREGARQARGADDELQAAIGLAEGRVLEQLEREAESLAAYRRVAERFSERPEAERALFRAADLLLRARRYADAKAACQRLLVSNPVTRFRRRCLWSVAWAEYRLGRPKQANQFLATLVRGSLPADLDAAARYWLGRTEGDLGRGEAARKWYRDVLERHPLGFYAALAERQLVEAPKAASTRSRTEKSALPEGVEKAWEYHRLGLRQRALDAATAYESSLEGRRPTADTYRALAQLYDALRRPRESRRVREQASRAYATGPGAEEFLAAARRAHPLKFEPEVRKAAREFNLPPSLLFALIRTESGFRQDAISAMDAYGLAQLILPTAQAVGRRIRAGPITRRRLLDDPRLNIRLGAAYLKQLLELYGGSEPLALAAYNAGPQAVDAWRRRRIRQLSGVSGRGIGLTPAADEFAEEIPVTETRRFVKAVLSRARAYAVLYPSAAPEAVDEADPAAASPSAVALVEPAQVPEAPEIRFALPAGIHAWREDALTDPDEYSIWGWPNRPGKN